MEQKRLPLFAERFAELRGNRTQAEFADFLGLSRPTIGFYENGTRIPDALVLCQIAEKCEVSADWLLGLSDVRANDNLIKDICNYTGLTENAVKILAKRRDSSPLRKVQSFIIEEDDFFIPLANYLLSFIAKKVAEGKLKWIPLRENSLKYTVLPDVCFSAIISRLPKIKDRFEKASSSDNSFMDSAMFDYLRRTANIERCEYELRSDDLIDIDDEYELDYLELLDSDEYAEYMSQPPSEEELAAREKMQDDLKEQYTVIYEFMKRLKEQNK